MAFKLAIKLCRVTASKPCSEKPRLISIGFSHFCEKARWVLDLSPLPYYEEMHCPGVHLSSTLNLTKVRRISNWKDSHFDDVVKNQTESTTFQRKEKSAVPKLLIPKNYAIKNGISDEDSIISFGSCGIAKFLSVRYTQELGHLYPDGPIGDRVIDFESYLDVTLGPAAMKWAFGNLLLSGEEFLSSNDPRKVDSNFNKDSSRLFLRKATTNTIISPVERFLVKQFGAHIVPIMTRNNGISAAAREDGLRSIKEVLGVADDMLQRAADQTKANNQLDKDVFLFGTDKPTAADIAFAALTLPVLLPPQTQHL